MARIEEAVRSQPSETTLLMYSEGRYEREPPILLMYSEDHYEREPPILLMYSEDRYEREPPSTNTHAVLLHLLCLQNVT